MKKFSYTLIVVLFCGLMMNKIFAQDMSNKMDNMSASTVAKLVSDDMTMSSKKIISLAEAMPAEDYGWRPEEGVRSVGETYVHIAMSNYFLLSFLGADIPEGFDQKAEKNMTKKEDIVNFLKKSFADAQKFLGSYSDTDYDTVVDLPFGKMSKGQILMIVATHPHEHLGQSIAYARSNHITPPWSRKNSE